MTTAIKRRRGTTSQHNTFTGLDGELTVDTTKETLVIHDGATAGGFPLLREDLNNNSNVATLSGTQTFSGSKTFSNTISGSINGNAATATSVSGGSASVTTLTTSSTVTHNAGTANGVTYLNGSKVLTSGSALTFDGAILGVNGVSVGRGAGAVATNTAVGASALSGSNTAGFNVAVGNSALAANTSGQQNTAVGSQAGLAITTGSNNTAIGRVSMYSNTVTGSDNSALGLASLYSLTSGGSNTAVGSQSLQSNTTASNNTAVGYQAGYSNTTGTYNTFIGYQAGYSNTTFGTNTFVGREAGYSNTTGYYNTFIGAGGSGGAGNLMTTGLKNTIIGGFSGNQGGLDIRTASNYIVLSDGDGTPRLYMNGGSSLVCSSVSTGAGTNAMRYNTTTGNITYDTSSARYKDNIRDSIYGLSHVMQMRSTQFEYKDDGRSDVGFIAEEFDLIVPELVGRNKDGEPDSVSYDRMVSVLTKAIQEQQAIINAQQAALTTLTARVTALEGNP